MKVLALSLVLLAGSCGGFKLPDFPVEPSPKPTEAPSPVPSPPVASPSPSPTVAPTAPPTPIPSPSPTPSSAPTPVPSPKPWKCTEAYERANDCGCCDGNITWARRTTNWVCPNSYPGNPSSCSLDGNPAPCPVYDPVYGNGFCYSTGEGKQHIDRQCNHVDRDGRILHHSSTGYLGKVCQAPVSASPSPVPPVPPTPPTPGPTPSPVSSNDATLFRVGLSDKIQNIVKGKHGTRYIINTTPRSRPPYCEHTTEKALWESYKSGDLQALGGQLTPAQEAEYKRKEASGGLLEIQRNECEQLPSRQDPRGPRGYQTHLGGLFTNDELEQNSGNTYLFQIKISDPKEAGDYLIRVCPYDDPRNSPRCSEKIYRDIKP